MNKKTISVIAVTLCVLFAALSLTSCGASKIDPDLVSHWESDNSNPSLFLFNEDGTGRLFDSLTIRDFTYTVKDNTVFFTYNVDYPLKSVKYKIDNDELSMISPDGYTSTYTKK